MNTQRGWGKNPATLQRLLYDYQMLGTKQLETHAKEQDEDEDDELLTAAILNAE